MKKNPVTREGYQALKNKLHQLKTIDRHEVIQAIATARAHGDLSENAEYSAAKEKQAFIEYQINLINQKLRHVHIVEKQEKSSTILFGDTVTIKRKDNNSVFTYTIVGEDEADIGQNKISCHSPLAKNLIGQSCDKEVTINTPRGKITYQILKIN